MNRYAAFRQEAGAEYGVPAPYDPDTGYLEYEYQAVCKGKNWVYENLRKVFLDMELDKDRIGTKEWSPFRGFISPGETVVIKPNLVLDMKTAKMQEYTTTHPSVVRVVIDYCWKALGHQGTIIVGDAPSAEADFQRLAAITGYQELIEEMRSRGVHVTFLDFRAVKVVSRNGIWVKEQKAGKGHPGKVVVNLGKHSLFYQDGGRHKKYHGGGYDIRQTTAHHKGARQEYCVSKTVLDADVVISVPKLKTHRKAGITCCLKNLVGINCDKNYLPHFTVGSSNMGGDEMPPIRRRNVCYMAFYNFLRENVIAYTWKYIGNWSVRVLNHLGSKTGKRKQGSGSKEVDCAKWLHNKISGSSVAAGAWQGNITITKMILDLNKIFLYCDKQGKLQPNAARKVFYVVDGLWAGMGNGPVDALPVKTGLLGAGYNGALIDTELLKLCNIEPGSIPLYREALQKAWLWKKAGKGSILLNGEMVAEGSLLPIKIIPPDHWQYEVRIKDAERTAYK